MQCDLDGVLPDGIPEDWSYRRLQDIAAHITKGATPTTYGFAWESVDNKGAVPFMRSECVQDGEFVTLMMGAIPPKAHAMMARSSVLGGDLLMTITGNIGRVCRYPESAPEANINQHIARIRLVKTDLVDPSYAFWALHSPRQQSRLMKDLTGLAYPQISLAQVQEIPLPSPPLPEQRRIAEILDTLDEAIRKTEQVIVKLQQMKQGLLHDLLTRGIDENGELRDPERHPEQFKDSPLGRIPRGWEVQSMESLAIGGIANGVFKEPQRVGTGIPLVNVSDLYEGFGVDLRHCELFDAKPAEKRQFAALCGDLFFTRSSLNLAGIAHCNLLRGHADDAVYECHLMRIRPNPIKVNPAFLALWSQSMFARRFLMSRAKQTTMTTISQPDLAPLPVPLPPLVEQLAIVDRFDVIHIKVNEEQVVISKLRSLKQGLMDDLLTGRVRVKPEEAE
ncbi:MAG: restriction endonuclease subunit S [Cyanobacteriota bacterium]|jgi:type I restriction enzyme S subunit